MAPVMLWDFDRTLAYREEGWSATTAAVARQAGYPLETEDVRPHLVGAFPWERPEKDHRSLCAPDTWWARMTARIAGAYRGCGLPDELVEELAGRFRAAYLDLTRWHVYPDTVPALRALSKAGWTHVVCSNHVPELPELIKGLGLAPLLERVISSALVGWEKPNPAIYHAALEGLAPPEEAWMAGDNYTADVAGPERLGIQAILVRSEHPAAARQCPDLLALAQRLGAAL